MKAITKRLFTFGITAGLLLATPVFADDKESEKTAKKSAKKEAVDPELKKDIRKMLKLSGQGELGIQVMESMIGSFKVTMPDVPDSFWKDFMNEVDADGLIEMVVPVYAKHFTRDDIKAMVEFYNSPVGKKLIKKQPLIMQESMAVGEAWGTQISEKLLKRLQEKGYRA